jgi:hypothetical protein
MAKCKLMIYKVTRVVTTSECPWLDKNMARGQAVYKYYGCTYGCVGETGIAVTVLPNAEPFFELPSSALELVSN